MKSVRLGDELEGKLKRAARKQGVSESDFIRAAIAERADSMLGDDLESRLAGIIGAVHAGGGQAAHAHERYHELLKQRYASKKKSRR